MSLSLALARRSNLHLLLGGVIVQYDPPLNVLYFDCQVDARRWCALWLAAEVRTLAGLGNSLFSLRFSLQSPVYLNIHTGNIPDG